jgi:hypothetical protein
MADLIYIAIALAFFALCVLYVRWCDRIIGPDVFEADRADDIDTVPTASVEEVAA